MKPTKILLISILLGLSAAMFAQVSTNPTNNTTMPVGGQNAGQNFNQQMVPSSSGAVGASGFTGNNGTLGSPSSTGYTGVGGNTGYNPIGSTGSTGGAGTPTTPSNYYPMPQAPRRD